MLPLDNRYYDVASPVLLQQAHQSEECPTLKLVYL